MNFEEFKEKFHLQLNQQQEEAVQSVDAPTLLLAVPGSGKTTVLVTRLGYMIYCLDIPPEKILTVTYTVSATRDMRERFAELFGSTLAERLEFRTINGICAKIIGFYGSAIGRTPYEIVSDESQRNRLLAILYQDIVREYPTESDLQNLGSKITYIKNRMLTVEEILAMGEEENLPLYKIYRFYCDTMKQNKKMDYDDQMVYAYTLLRKVPDLRNHFRELYPYISVDEAQDTSRIQYEILKLLSGDGQHLFMVGDEDQSIYGFRAAYPESLLNFEEEHPGARVLLMEENFRSDKHIVEMANRFIQKNRYRHKKSMYAARNAKTEVFWIDPKGRRGQYTYLLEMARSCNMETAILYRDNESILPVLDLFERTGIAYRIRNSDLTFFSHRIVLDIKDIIRFAMNPRDTDIFMQIYYKMNMYMSRAVAMEACRISVERDLPILDAALRYCRMSPGTERNVRNTKKEMDTLLRERADHAVYRIVHFMGYGEYIEKMHMKPNKAHILESIAKNEPNPVRLLERLDELADIIKNKSFDSEAKIILSTIHSSKGLEYDRVFLLDVKDGVFPEEVIRDPKRALPADIKAYEEERRLFYVGATRAKNMLCIFDFKSNSTFATEFR